VLEQYIKRGLGPDWQDRVPLVLCTAVYMLMYADVVVLVSNPSLRGGSQRAGHAWLFQGQPEELVQQCKYLGIILYAVKGISTAAEHLAQAGQWALSGCCAGPVLQQQHC
jgi:hypothetical protein